MDQSKHSLVVESIYKVYEGSPLLRGIDLKVESGQTLCLLGRSGSGKSTLLRIIAGLEKSDQGQVLWDGATIDGIPAWQRRFGLMFQEYALFPHMDVAHNVAFGLRMQNRPRNEIADAVQNALRLVNMQSFAERSVSDLSGGEKQRVALARALAPGPRLLMLDEPLAALDRTLRADLQEELRSLLHQTGIPAIYVTHDQEEAFILGDRVAILAEGLIAQEGKPEEVYRQPKNRRVAEFLGMSNFMEGSVDNLHPFTVKTAEGIFVPSDDPAITKKVGDKVTLLLRSASGVSACDEAHFNQLTGIVLESDFRGEDYQVKIQSVSSRVFTFSLSEALTVGQHISLELPESAIVCLE